MNLQSTQRDLAARATVAFNLCRSLVGPTQAPKNDRLNSKLRKEVEARATAAEGDPDARRLWLEATRLWWDLALTELTMARQEARRMHARGEDDMAQEALFGLNKAARRWEPERKVSFRVYARWWVRAQLFRAFEEQERSIALSFNARTKLHLAQRLQEYGADPCDAGITLEEFQRLSIANQSPMELDAPLTDEKGEEQGTTRADRYLRDEWTPEDEVTGWEERNVLKERLRRLNPRARKIIIHRMGGGSVHAIGEELGLSKEWVRQITLDAMLQLRDEHSPPFGPAVVSDVFGFHKPTKAELEARAK